MPLLLRPPPRLSTAIIPSIPHPSPVPPSIPPPRGRGSSGSLPPASRGRGSGRGSRGLPPASRGRGRRGFSPARGRGSSNAATNTTPTTAGTLIPILPTGTANPSPNPNNPTSTFHSLTPPTVVPPHSHHTLLSLPHPLCLFLTLPPTPSPIPRLHASSPHVPGPHFPRPHVPSPHLPTPHLSVPHPALAQQPDCHGVARESAVELPP
ncbi:unnamed protein product [Closterium sp. NIES-53]